MILLVVQRNITVARQKQLGNTIFINHIAQIIGSCGCATYLMYSPEFRTVSTISIGNSTAIGKTYYTWQI